MPKTDTYEDILAEVYGPRRSIIKALRFFGGEVNSKKLFDEADAPRSSKHHYLSTLSDDLGLIEKVGQEHAGHGGQAFVWALTDRGEMVANDIEGEDAATIDDVELLQERVEVLERKLDASDHVDPEQVQANSESIEELREEIQSLEGDIQFILDKIKAMA